MRTGEPTARPVQQDCPKPGGWRPETVASPLSSSVQQAQHDPRDGPLDDDQDFEARAGEGMQDLLRLARLLGERSARRRFRSKGSAAVLDWHVAVAVALILVSVMIFMIGGW